MQATQHYTIACSPIWKFKMADKLLLVHDKALRSGLDVYEASESFKAVHIWDDEYYRSQRYSLKRLVFIYETLLDLPLEIIHGNTLDILSEENSDHIVIPYSGDPVLKTLFSKIEKIKTVQYLFETSFVNLDRTVEFKRFFKYWNQAKKTAFLINGDRGA